MRYLSANHAPKIPNNANCAIFLSKNFYCFNLLGLQIFFGFTFKYKIIHFQSKNLTEKVVLPPNKSKQSAFFLFQAVIGYISSNHGTCYVKNESTGPNSQQHRPPGCLVDLRYL